MRLFYALPFLFLAACGDWSSTEESANEEYNALYSSAIAFSSSDGPSSSSLYLEPGSSSLYSSSAGFYSSDTVHLKSLNIASMESWIGSLGSYPPKILQWIAYLDSLANYDRHTLDSLTDEGLLKVPGAWDIGKHWCDFGNGPFDVYSINTKSSKYSDFSGYSNTTKTVVLSAGDTVYQEEDVHEWDINGMGDNTTTFQCQVQGRIFKYHDLCEGHGSYSLPLPNGLYLHIFNTPFSGYYLTKDGEYHQPCPT